MGLVWPSDTRRCENKDISGVVSHRLLILSPTTLLLINKEPPQDQSAAPLLRFLFRAFDGIFVVPLLNETEPQ